MGTQVAETPLCLMSRNCRDAFPACEVCITTQTRQIQAIENILYQLFNILEREKGSENRETTGKRDE